MRIVERVEHRVTVLRLEGEVDSRGGAILEQMLQDVVAGGRRQVVVDFSGVEGLTVDGAAIVRGALRAAKISGGDLRLAGLRPGFADTLLPDGTVIAPLLPSADAAVSAFASGLSDHQTDGVNVLTPRGDLNGDLSPALELRVRELLDEGENRFVLDLTNVTHLTPEALQTIQHIMSAARARAGDLRLAGLPPSVRETLVRAGYADLVSSYGEPLEAVRSYAAV